MKYQVTQLAALLFLGVLVAPAAAGVAVSAIPMLALVSQGLNILGLLPTMLLFGALVGILYGSVPALISIVACVVLRKGKPVTFRLFWMIGSIVSVLTTILIMLSQREPLTNAPGMVVLVLVGGALASAMTWQVAKGTRVIVPEPAI